MKQYMTPKRFTVFYIEHKERDGSLAVVPKTVMSLSDADVAAIRKMNPKVAAQLKPLPQHPKPQPKQPEPQLDMLTELSEEFEEYEDEEDADL